jgi:hypothetical protein
VDATKVYDGGTSANVTGRSIPSGILAGETVTLDGGVANYSDKNVADDKTVSLTGATLGGADALNYELDSVETTTANITALELTIFGALAQNRDYNQLLSVEVGGGTLVGVIGDDAVTLDDSSAAGQMATKVQGIGKSVTVTGYALSGAGAGNYTVAQPTGVTVDIARKSLVGTFTADNKVYDGNRTASVLTRSANQISGDVVELTGGTATFSDKNAADGKLVSLADATLTGADADNYTLLSVTDATANITKIGLTGAFTVDATKVYDGGTSANVTGRSIPSGILAGETVTLDGGTANYSDKNVADDKTVSLTGATLGGADALNYELDSVDTTTANITALELTISGALAQNRDYNQLTSVEVGGGTLVGVIGDDEVAIDDSAAAGEMATKNQGDGKSVTVTGYALSGAGAGNYTVAQPTDVTVDIARKSLVGTFTADNKVYDGNRTASVLTRFANQISGDEVELTGGTATFSDKNAADDKSVSLADATLTGADADNYTLLSVTDATANITKKSLTGAFTVDATKVYDGGTSANVTGRLIPSGIVGSDVVTLDGGTANYSDKNVANDKTVTLTGATLGGADSANYELDSVNTTTANITKKDVSGSFTVADRQYDGTSIAVVATTSVPGMVEGDILQLDYISDVTVTPAGTFNNPNVGNSKTVTPSAVLNWALSGTDEGNYNLTSINTTTANITKRTLNVTATIQNRVYDGTTAATIVSLTTDKLPLDSVTVTATGAAFLTKTAGDGKTVTVSGLALSGTSASQYELVSTVITATANITKAPLTLNFSVTATKVYDGNDTANVTGSGLTPPVFGDDAVGVTGVEAKYNDKNVGTNKAVTVTNYTLTGADAGNYEVTAFSPTTASITAKTLTVSSFTASDKVYDGTTSATVSDVAFVGLVGSDTVTLGGTASFADKNVDTGKTVTIANPSLAGTDAANYTLSGGVGTATADITAKTLTLVYTASNKPFDGNTNATATLASDDRVSGDILTISYGTATFADIAIDTNKDVTISDISVTGDDAGNYTYSTSQVVQASITNNAPVVTASSGTTPYLLTNAPTVIDDSIVVEDIESAYGMANSDSSLASLAGGWLEVTFETVVDAGDFLWISEQGTGSGEIGLSGTDVTYGGEVIGTVSGNGSSELRIDLNASANVESLQALARRIAFENYDPSASTDTRTVQFQVNDGTTSSNIATKGVFISAGNEAPVVTLSSGSTNYTEGTAAVSVDSGLTILDQDQTNFANGQLTVSLEGSGQADDVLGIASSETLGAINVSGASVRIVTASGYTEIGTITSGADGSASDVVISLNSEATLARTQLLARSIVFSNTSNNPDTTPRGVAFTLNDGDSFNGTSVPVTKTVTVTPVNNAPTITLSGFVPTFTEPTGPTTDTQALPASALVDSGVTVSDPDSANFSGGSLRVSNPNSNNADRFGIRQTANITLSSGTLSGGNYSATNGANVLFDGTVIGTIATSNASTLQITLNAEATPARVSALMQAVTFRNTGDLPGTSREATFQVTDNASATINSTTPTPVTKTITIVSTNDAPRMTGTTTSLALVRNAASGTAPIGTSPSAFVDPFDTLNNVPTTMNGGTLTLAGPNSSANYSLTVDGTANNITVSGSTILHSGTAIATFSGGSGSSLVITFNAEANATRINALLRQLRIRALTGSLGGSMTLTLDEAMEGSTTVAKSVTLTRTVTVSG